MQLEAIEHRSWLKKQTKHHVVTKIIQFDRTHSSKCDADKLCVAHLCAY